MGDVGDNLDRVSYDRLRWGTIQDDRERGGAGGFFVPGSAKKDQNGGEGVLIVDMRNADVAEDGKANESTFAVTHVKYVEGSHPPQIQGYGLARMCTETEVRRSLQGRAFGSAARLNARWIRGQDDDSDHREKAENAGIVGVAAKGYELITKLGWFSSTLAWAAGAAENRLLKSQSIEGKEKAHDRRVGTDSMRLMQEERYLVIDAIKKRHYEANVQHTQKVGEQVDDVERRLREFSNVLTTMRNISPEVAEILINRFDLRGNEKAGELVERMKSS